MEFNPPEVQVPDDWKEVFIIGERDENITEERKTELDKQAKEAF